MLSKNKFSILPVWCSYTGFFLMIIGGFLLYYFVYLGVKPDWMQLKVFTVYSKYLKTTKFDYIINNQGDELACFIYFVGFLKLFCSKSKKQNTETIKVYALVYALLIVFVIFVVGYLFIHGMAIFFVSIGVLFTLPVIYVIVYLVLMIFSK